ncbi:MAG TPA: serine/threonine-protein kinase [Enhygromyxa sp.]|nr:serine/threonine-protein kinase [Enhygromyxa sp.]
MADDRKSGDGPKAGEISPEQKPADPSYWAELVELVHDSWMMEVVGAGKRHKIGRFEGIRLIGEGGNGVVFLVRDPDLDREVALKLCRVPGRGAGDAILREAQLLAKISHSNIITVHESGRYGDDVFYVMEFIAGMNGHKFIYRSRSWQEVIEVYIAAGTGLAVAHEQGIIHGDFKPGNILIPDNGGPVRVADFGLARVMYEDGAGIPHRVGTLPYMAPEVLRGQPSDARSDQWSFCVALWQTLEAVLPYSGETVSELLSEIDQGEPRVAEPWVPENVRSVVRVGLLKDPKDRYADMRTLVHELGKLLASPGGKVAGESSEKRPVEPGERLLNGPAAQPAGLGRPGLVYGSLLASTIAVLVLTLALFRSLMLPSATTQNREGISAEEMAAEPNAGEITAEEVIAKIEQGDLESAYVLWASEMPRRRAENQPCYRDTIKVGNAYMRQARLLEQQRKLEAAKTAAHKAEAMGFAAVGDLAYYGQPVTAGTDLATEAAEFYADLP